MVKLIGKKLGMTSVFNEDGAMIPVTLIELGPCPVTQVKTVEKDGYEAYQIGFADGKKKKGMSKPLAGHIKASGSEALRKLIEVRASTEGMEPGKVLTVSEFDEKVPVSVIATTKGRGFAGGVKRYGFRGGDASHGEEKHHRTNGSLSSAARLTHVWKGKRMSGHYGNVRQTVKNLEIVKIDEEKNILVVKGSVPGHSGGTLVVVQ